MREAAGRRDYADKGSMQCPRRTTPVRLRRYVPAAPDQRLQRALIRRQAGDSDRLRDRTDVQLRTRGDQHEREGLRDGVAGVGGAELAPHVREVERDGALGNLQRLADFRNRLTACRVDQTLPLAVAEKPARSAVEPAQRCNSVGTAPGNARRGVVNGARDELAIRQGREDAALRRGAATGQREAGEAPLPARPVNGARNPRRESEFACLREGLAVPRRDFFPGQRRDLLQGETAQRSRREIPIPIGAVSVPVNWKVIEPG